MNRSLDADDRSPLHEGSVHPIYSDEFNDGDRERNSVGHSSSAEAEAEDDVELARMGYKQELGRGFSSFMAFSFCLTAVAVIGSISIGFEYGLQTGGSTVILYGWIIGSTFTVFVGLSMAEICSTYPSAGAVYSWAGILAPSKYAGLSAYICGWFNFIGNAAGDAAFASGFATITNAVIVLNSARDSAGKLISSNMAPLSTEQQVLLSIGITGLWALQNAMKIDQMGWLNNVASFFQIGSTFGIVIALFASCGSHIPDRISQVFTASNNSTGFDSFFYVCMIGILSTLFSFSGYEAGAHMAEETKGASKAAPKGIVYTCLVSALIGLFYLLALLFAIPDISVILPSSSAAQLNPNATIAVFQQCLPSISMAVFLATLIIINLYFAGMSSLTVTSRIAFAMARDQAFPASNWLKYVNPRVKMPLRTVFLVFIVDSLFLLMPLVSSTAFSAILSIATVGFQISYAIPIFLRITFAKNSFIQSDFSLGRFSLACGWISSAWLALTSLLLFFPTQLPITAESMNYTVVVFVAVSAIGAVYWLVYARHFFTGPKRHNHNKNSSLADDKGAALLLS
jgi:amino acid transporter